MAYNNFLVRFLQKAFAPNKRISQYLKGAGSIFDFSGPYVTHTKKSTIDDLASDYDAIASDWEAVGKDIMHSLKYHLSEITDPNEHQSAKGKLGQSSRK